MRPIVLVIGPSLLSSANDICTSQTPGAKGNMTLNGSTVANGVATLVTPGQRVLITTADSTTIFTLYGTTATGAVVTECLISNGTSVQSTLDYYTVTQIAVNQGTTAAVTVGTNGVGSTPWVHMDWFADAQIAIQCTVSGTVNYTVQSSLDPESLIWTNPALTSTSMTWVNSSDTAAVNATATIQTNYAYCPRWIRCLLNSGSGSVTMTVLQSGVAAY